MGFRTVFTHGMKTTAKVIVFFLQTKLLRCSWPFRVYFHRFSGLVFDFSFCTFSSFSVPLFFLFFLYSAEKRSKGLFHQITKTHGTVIGVSSGIVLVLLIISILVQMKQPRKKVTHPLCLTFCSAGKQTEPEEKRHLIESDGGISGWMGFV